MNAEESFELLRQLIKAQGVKTLVMPESLWNISSFDHGLRGQLYRNYDYADIARWIRENCLTPWDLLSLQDPFGISYILLRTDNITNQESYYISIGPYIDIRNQRKTKEQKEKNPDKLGFDRLHRPAASDADLPADHEQDRRLCPAFNSERAQAAVFLFP